MFSHEDFKGLVKISRGETFRISYRSQLMQLSTRKAPDPGNPSSFVNFHLRRTIHEQQRAEQQCR